MSQTKKLICVPYMKEKVLCDFGERIRQLRKKNDLSQEQLAERVALTVLDQSIYELAHVLKESRQFDRTHIDDALASLEYMHLEIVPYNAEITRKATQIAFEHSISMYAAGFIALGAHLRCQAVTSDSDLYRQVASLPWTVLLADLNF